MSGNCAIVTVAGMTGASLRRVVTCVTIASALRNSVGFSRQADNSREQYLASIASPHLEGRSSVAKNED
jgi:hypothetical protein